MVEVSVEKVQIGDHALPVMTINLKDSSVVSIPSQIGCPVNCDFCISKESAFVRNLKAEEMVRLAKTGLSQALHPTIMSFTGEGEPILNATHINKAMHLLEEENQVERFRISMSGIRSENLDLISKAHKPTNLQLSLHSPFDEIRQKLIQNTKNIEEILADIRKHQHKFGEIAINYVLMRGINDSPTDLSKLMELVDKHWVIKLNPLISDTPKYQASSSTGFFEHSLRRLGYNVKKYTKVGSNIRNRLYDSLTYHEKGQ